MPELPEVETIRRQLAPRVRGPADRRDRRCWTRAGASRRRPRRWTTRCEGRRVVDRCRRGKYLVSQLEDERDLVMHLRMTGTLLLDPPDEPTLRARRGSPSTAAPRAALLRPRRFGTGELVLGRLRSTSSSTRGSGSSRCAPTSRRCAAAPRARAASARQGVPARPAPRRRRGQHLRRRGAVPRPHPSAAPGRRAEPRAVGAPSRRRCATRSTPGSTPAARRSTTSATPTASAEPSRTSSSSTAATASPARRAAARSASSWPPGAAPTCASAASRARAGGAGPRSGRERRRAHRPAPATRTRSSARTAGAG